MTWRWRTAKNAL